MKGKANRLVSAVFCLLYFAPQPTAEAKVKAGESVVVLMLLLSWFILAVTYRLNPVFRRSFKRYFSGHQFYVKDVLQRHIRSLIPGTSMLLQHILLSGIMFYAVANSLLSTTGRTLLFSSYPALTLFGESAFAFAWWGMLIAVFFEALCVLWLWLVNPQITHLSQVFNLYPWLLQLNILLATIAATVYLSSGSHFLLYIFGILFFLLLFAAFIVASIDAVEFSDKKQRLWVVSCTTVLYIVLLTSIALWIFLSPRLLNLIEQALTLP